MDLQKTQEEAFLAVKHNESLLENFYQNYFPEENKLQIIATLVKKIYKEEWENNQEKVWAEKMLNTSKKTKGTSNEDVHKELVYYIFELIKKHLPKVMQLGESKLGTQLTDNEINIILKELPNYLATYYITVLHYDLVNGRWEVT